MLISTGGWIIYTNNDFSTNQLQSCALGFWTYESWPWNLKSWSWAWKSESWQQVRCQPRAIDQGVKVGGNTWERRSQARQFCTPAFLGPNFSGKARMFLGSQVRPLTTAECERGFNRMNLVCITLRSCLSVTALVLTAVHCAFWSTIGRPYEFGSPYPGLSKLGWLSTDQMRTAHTGHLKRKFSHLRILLVGLSL